MFVRKAPVNSTVDATASIYGDVRNSRIGNHTAIHESATVDNATIGAFGSISGQVSRGAVIGDNSRIYEHGIVEGSTLGEYVAIYGKAVQSRVDSFTLIHEDGLVDNASIGTNASISGQVTDGAVIGDDTKIHREGIVKGGTIGQRATISGTAINSSIGDHSTILEGATIQDATIGKWGYISGQIEPGAVIGYDCSVHGRVKAGVSVPDYAILTQDMEASISPMVESIPLDKGQNLYTTISDGHIHLLRGEDRSMGQVNRVFSHQELRDMQEPEKPSRFKKLFMNEFKKQDLELAQACWSQREKLLEMIKEHETTLTQSQVQTFRQEQTQERNQTPEQTTERTRAPWVRDAEDGLGGMAD